SVGLGAVCAEPALSCLDAGAACVAGRCACVSPAVQHEARCVLPAIRKEVGPGEPCDQGEICTMGSTCDPMIPVCVCPPHTDLSNGVCVPVAPRPAPVVTVPLGPVPNGVPAYLTPTSTTSTTTTTTTAAPTTTTMTLITTQPTPVVQSTLSYKSIPVAPVDVRTQPYVPPVKPVKIQLGGSKQAGVGVACSLNTDCMIGAYCNGNTAPATCQCLSTHVNVEGRCEKVIYPGQSGCADDSQCAAAYTGSACVDRVCVCPTGARAIEQTCVPEVAAPLGACELFRVTLATDPTRPTFLPACPPDHGCLRQACAPLAGMRCADDVGCPRGYVCNNTHSRCEPRNRSRRSASALLTCDGLTESCAEGRGRCIGMKCECLAGFVQRDGDCEHDTLEIGQFCDPMAPSPRCADDAICLDQLCICRVPGGCRRRARRFPEEHCEDADECLRGAECRSGTCACPDDTVLTDGSCQRLIGAFKSIGVSCAPHDRCSGGSLCVAGVCSCTEGARDSGARCVQPPGGRCSHGQTCTGDAACEFGVCRCAPGARAEGASCVRDVAGPGESCQLGQRCREGAACRFGLCLCTGGKWALNGRCVRKTAIVEIEKTAWSADQGAEKAARHPGEVCGVNGACAGGPVCHKGYCICAGQGDDIVDNICIPASSTTTPSSRRFAPAGARCSAGAVECTPGTACLGGFCSCADGLIINASGVCAPKVTFHTYPKQSGVTLTPESKLEHGAKCSSTMECPYMTECMRGVCRCGAGETIGEGGCRRAITSVPPGGACDTMHGLDCVGEGRCIYGKCSCTRGLVPTAKECADPATLRKAAPGAPCDSDTFCIGGTTCIVGRCTSSASAEFPVLGALPLNTSLSVNIGDRDALRTLVEKHYQLPTLGEACEEICKDGAICLNRICACTRGTVESREGRCVEQPDDGMLMETYHDGDERADITLYGHECTGPADCPRAAFCFDRLCRCMHGHRAHAGSCEPVAGIGGACASATQCAHHAACVEGRCACAEGALAHAGRCPAARLAHPGDDCSRAQVCAFNAYCGLSSGVCECPGGMATVDGRCEQTTNEAGEACVTSSNCHKFSYCDNGFCLCKTGYALLNGFCVPLRQHMDLSSPYSMAINRPSDAVPDTPGLPPNRNAGPASPMAAKLAQAGATTPPPRFRTMMVANQNTAPGQPATIVIPPAPATSSAFPTTTTATLTPFRFVFNPNLFTTPPPPSTLFVPPPNPFSPLRFGSFPTPSPPTPAPVFSHPNLLMPTFGTPTTTMTPIFGAGVVHSPISNNPFTLSPAMMNTFFPNGQLPGIIPPAVARGTRMQPGDGSATVAPESRPVPMSSSFPNAELTAVAAGRIAMPGEFCGDGSLCIANAICKRHFCRCPKGSFAENGICVRKTSTKARKQPAADDQESLFIAEEQNLFGAVHDAEIDQHEEDEDETPAPSRSLAAPLESCANGESCGGGAECEPLFGFGRVCVCPHKTLLVGGECVARPAGVNAVAPGDRCTLRGDTVCIGGAACLNKKCRCPTGRKEKFGICLRISNPGDACEEGELCGEGSICSDTARTCVCPHGTRSVNGRCRAPTDTKKTKTKAPKFRVLRFNDTATVIAPGEECSEADRCADGGACEGGVCVCPADTLLADGRCVPVALTHALGEDCDDAIVCLNNSICNEEGVCACPPDRVDIDGECVLVPTTEVRRAPSQRPAIGAMSCTEDAQCPLDYQCLNSVCVCASQSSVACLSQLLLSSDAMCASAADCPSGAECVPDSDSGLRSCRCQDGSPATMEGCATAGAPGAYCARTAECAGDGICLDERCVCDFESVVSDDRCVKRHGLVEQGGACGFSGHCEPNLSCLEGTCTCLEWMECEIVNEPVTSPPGGSCSEARTCTGGAVCREGWCVCPEATMIVQKGQCVVSSRAPTPAPISLNAGKKIVPGAACSARDTCVGGSSCVAGVCRCPVGTTPSERTGRCEPVRLATVAPPAATTAPAPSPPPQQPPASSSNSIVDECAAIGLFCRSNTVCINRSCQCPEGTVLHGDRCVTPDQVRAPSGALWRKPYETCMNGEECCNGAICNDFKVPFCACPADRPVHMNGECVAKVVVIPGGVCDEYASVCSDGTTCTNGLCTCPAGSVAVSGRCVVVAASSTTPAATPQVVPPAAQPMTSSSPTTTPPHDSARPLAGPLKNCENGEICIGGSSCDAETGICMCPSGMAAFGDRCAIPPAFHSLTPLVGATVPPAPAPAPTTTTMETLAPLKVCCRPQGLPQLPTAQEAVRPMIVSVTVAPAAEPIVVTTPGAVPAAPTAAPTERPFVLSATSAPRCFVDSDCGADRVCAAGGCVCRPGTVEGKEGKCEMVQVYTIGDFSAAPAYSKFTSLSFNDDLPSLADDDLETTTTKRPRVVGPPLRRPKPPAPRGGGSGATNGAKGPLTLGGTGEGRCPPGNEPTRDEASGKLVLCNGLNPNCPPRSYCYVTRGGFATEDYNCCRSCRCYAPIDACDNGAHCLQGVCKCAQGAMLSPRGQCDPIVTATSAPRQFTFSWPTTAVTPSTTTSRPAPIWTPASPAASVASIAQPAQVSANQFPLGSRCWSDSACAGNAVCVQKMCVCPPNHVEQSGICVENVRSQSGGGINGEPAQKTVGDPCFSSNECPLSADCINGACACPDNHAWKKGRCVHASLVSFGLVSPGSSCDRGEICAGGSMCCADSKKCICALGHSIREGRCSSDDAPPFVGPAHSCSGGERCAGGSVCTGGRCACEADHLAEDGYCRPIAAPNADVTFAGGNGLRFKSKIANIRPRSTACDQTRCKLPDCFCTPSGRLPPGGLHPSQTPQFVVLTFDDAVNGRTLPDYKRLFATNRFNSF
ncbi:hypothetical protein PFISCL1PPCAC_25454, partial [Pristionchus fissidentatus]